MKDLNRCHCVLHCVLHAIVYYSIVGATVTVHQFFCILHVNILQYNTLDHVSQVYITIQTLLIKICWYLHVHCKPKAQVHRCDHTMSLDTHIACLSLIFQIFDFCFTFGKRRMDFDETCRQARTRHPLQTWCFSGQSVNKDGYHGL